MQADTVEALLFISPVVVAVVDAVKSLVPKVTGALTILVAGAIGALIAVVDVHIGVSDFTIAQGILGGLSAAGLIGGLKKIGTSENVSPVGEG